MSMLRLSAFLAILLTLSSALRAEVKLAPLFADHMVLQQSMPVPVWGWAAADESIEVTFAGQKVSAQAGADGKWKVQLQPLTATNEGSSMTITESNTIAL